MRCNYWENQVCEKQRRHLKHTKAWTFPFPFCHLLFIQFSFTERQFRVITGKIVSFSCSFMTFLSPSDPHLDLIDLLMGECLILAVLQYVKNYKLSCILSQTSGMCHSLHVPEANLITFTCLQHSWLLRGEFFIITTRHIIIIITHIEIQVQIHQD